MGLTVYISDRNIHIDNTVSLKHYLCRHGYAKTERAVCAGGNITGTNPYTAPLIKDTEPVTQI